MLALNPRTLGSISNTKKGRKEGRKRQGKGKERKIKKRKGRRRKGKILLKIEFGAEQVYQKLMAFIVLAKDLTLGPSTHTMAHNYP